MIQKNEISRDVLIISVLSLLTILAWVGMDVHRKLTKKEVPEILEKQLLPLDPEVDTKIMDVLESRLGEIPNFAPTIPVIENEDNSEED